MSNSIRVLAFAGSARKDSYNKRLLPIVSAGAEAAGGSVTIADLADFPMPLFNEDLEAKQGMPEHARRFKELMLEHDALIIASPEYNSAFSPLLKNTLDWVSRSEADDEASLSAYRGKVAGILAASPGALGGLRGLVFLRMLLGNLGVLVVPKQQAIRQAYKAFNDTGTLIDERHNRAVMEIGSEVVRVARGLSA